MLLFCSKSRFSKSSRVFHSRIVFQTDSFFCFFFYFQRIYTIHQLFAILLSFFWSLSEFSYASLVKKNASLVSRLPEERWRRIGNKHKSCNLDVDANSPLGAIYGSVLCITKCLSVYMYYLLLGGHTGHKWPEVWKKCNLRKPQCLLQKWLIILDNHFYM